MDNCFQFNHKIVLIFFIPNSNDFGPCVRVGANAMTPVDAVNGAIDISATIHAAAFAIQQAGKLNVPKLRIYTDCIHLFGAVNGHIEMWRANGWLSQNNGQPLQERADYEKLDRVMRSAPIDIEFELLDANSEDGHYNEASRLALHFDDWQSSKLTMKEIKNALIRFLKNVIRDAVASAENDNRNTITLMDVINALERFYG